METPKPSEALFVIDQDLLAETSRKMTGRNVTESSVLGRLHTDTLVVEAGSWQEIRLTYVVGNAGLAKGGSLKILLRPDSDWANFQTWDPGADNYLCVELVLRESSPSCGDAHVLTVRFDPAAEEKSILVSNLAGYLESGDVVHVRLGDRRFGGRGTRVQTFAEKGFLFRALVDARGTSCYSQIDLLPVLVIKAGPPSMLRIIAPSSAHAGAVLPVLVRVEDKWGNVSEGVAQRACLEICDPAGKTAVCDLKWTNEPWAVFRSTLNLEVPGEYQLCARPQNGTPPAEFTIRVQETPEPRRSLVAAPTPYESFSGHPNSGADILQLHLV